MKVTRSKPMKKSPYDELDHILLTSKSLQPEWQRAADLLMKNGGRSQHQDYEFDPNISPVPVSWFKWPHLKQPLWKNRESHRVFLSSGTENHHRQQEQPWIKPPGRSRSLFSKVGLQLYKLSSVIQFIHVLERTGFKADDFQGISLIPKINDWPDSSLAQMIHWFAEYMDVIYITELPSLSKLADLAQKKAQPLWIFGTAEHFLTTDTPIKMSHAGQKHFKSMVFCFETGGFKSHTSSHNLGFSQLRKELYYHISKILHIPLAHIGGEYSASELASQAWSFLDGHGIPSFQRPYYFPNYVKIAIRTTEKDQTVWFRAKPESDQGRCQINKGDVGELCLYDPLRWDFPYPMNMEDVVQLSDMGGFWPAGRVVITESKGCSLRVNSLQGSDYGTKKIGDPSLIDLSRHTTTMISLTGIGDQTPTHVSPAEMLSFLTGFFRGKQCLQLLIEEFFDPKVATLGYQHLCQALPQSSDELQKALQVAWQDSFIPSTPKNKKVLMIPAGNHSLVCLYSLIFLLLSGVEVIIRYPEGLQGRLLTVFVGLLSSRFQLPVTIGHQLSRLNKSTDIEGLDGIVVFGSNETVKYLEQLFPHQVLGFGSRVAINVLEHVTRDNVLLSFHDFIALGGRGCMSSQLLCLPQSGFPLWRKVMAEQTMPRMTYTHQLSVTKRWRELTASYVACEYLGQLANNKPVNDNSRDLTQQSRCLFPVYFLGRKHRAGLPYNISKDVIGLVLESLPYVLPTLFYQELSELLAMLSSHRQIFYVASDSQEQLNAVLSRHSIRKLGELNLQPWDGYYENKPLFSLG
ncbi:MAG: hypothetical protein OXC40_00470 [Proteobacteria bacterium]|nr:hypothetical protein [Pseudomonadota bacterium]